MFFFPFLFSCYNQSVCFRVVRIVSGGCNQFSFVLFYVVLESLYRWVNAVFNAGKSSPPSTSFLWCNVLCMVISFLVLWSICLSSSLIHIKKVPEYLTGGTAQVFIPLIRFLQHSFVSSSFLVLLRYSFLIFSFISTCLMVSASKMPKYLYVSFSPSVQILFWFRSSILSIRCLLPLFMAHFSMSDSFPMLWLYILTACIRSSSSFSFFCK